MLNKKLFFLSVLVGNFKKSIDGSLNFTLAVFSLLEKGRSSCTGLLKIGEKFLTSLLMFSSEEKIFLFFENNLKIIFFINLKNQ